MEPRDALLGWMLIGVGAGVVSRWWSSHRDPGGVVAAILIGIAGALLAGFVARSIAFAHDDVRAAYLAAAVGAATLLVLYRLVLARRL